MFQFKRILFPLLVPSMLLFNVGCDKEVKTKQGKFWVNGKGLLWSDKGACRTGDPGCRPVQFIAADGKPVKWKVAKNAQVAPPAELNRLAVDLKDPSLAILANPDLTASGPGGLMFSLACAKGVNGICNNMEVLGKGFDVEQYGVGVSKGQIFIHTKIHTVQLSCKCCPENGQCCEDLQKVGAFCRIVNVLNQRLARASFLPNLPNLPNPFPR